MSVDPHAPPLATPWVPLWPISPLSPGTLIVPIRLRVPRSTSLAANAGFGVSSLTAWDMAAWEFADAAEGRIYGHARLPTYQGVTPQLALILAAATAGNVRMQVKTHLVGPGESLNPAAFTTTLGPFTATLATGYAVTEHVITPVVAANKTLLVEITRFGADAADTLANPLLLLDAFLSVGQP